MSVPLLLALGSAALFAVAALLVKRASELGSGLWRTAFVANLMTVVVFQPLWLLGGEWQPDLWWQPVITALCFSGGQFLTFLAFETGDVSVAAPVMGIKILLVALLVTWWAGEALRWQLWLAALLASIGVAVLNASGGPGRPRFRVGRTVLIASAAAAAYAVFDVLTQLWSPRWGLGRFLPLTVTCGGLLAFLYVPRFRGSLADIPGPTWRWLLAGTAAMGVQSAGITGVIAHWGGAAPVNVVYGSRGLWSVLAVWVAGAWVGSRERSAGPAVLRARLAGAILMLGAIALVLG
ncbi:MAG: EamA family transporter [Opitutaceae bacterium]